jgi:hypothetical protein
MGMLALDKVVGRVLVRYRPQPTKLNIPTVSLGTLATRDRMIRRWPILVLSNTF